MIKNKKWFSLPLALWLVIVMVLLAYSILEYIIPFSRDIKGVENSSIAYYQANNWIEEWLYKVYIRNKDTTIANVDEYWEDTFSAVIGSKYSTLSTSSWGNLPPIWEGNSFYNNNWGTISQWNPIQLYIWKDYLSTSIAAMDFTFRVPNIEDGTSLFLTGATVWNLHPIINWQISSVNETLNASWSIIYAVNVCGSVSDDTCSSNTEWYNPADWKDLEWVDLDLTPTSITTFYTNNCTWTDACILKFSVINKLETPGGTSLPYLEYRITTGSNIIPLQYSTIEASWKSYWYRKDIEVKVAWNTVNEAFDFTIFQ